MVKSVDREEFLMGTLHPSHVSTEQSLQKKCHFCGSKVFNSPPACVVLF